MALFAAGMPTFACTFLQSGRLVTEVNSLVIPHLSPEVCRKTPPEDTPEGLPSGLV